MANIKSTCKFSADNKKKEEEPFGVGIQYT